MTDKLQTFRFGKYTLRPATPRDHALVKSWIEKDPFHASTTKPDFFLFSTRGMDCYVLEDDEGPIFFFKMTRAVRLDIQFGPSRSTEERERNRDALSEGLAWLNGVLWASGFRQVLFNSENPVLVRSCTKRLGFVASPHELVRYLAEYPEQPVENSGRTEQQVQQGGA